MTNEADLRANLNHFRESFIAPSWCKDMDDRRGCVLRRRMIDWLVKMRPETVEDWWHDMPAFLQGRTDADQFEHYAERIIQIVRRHSRA